MEYLEEAYDRGFRTRLIAYDPVLDPLREDPRFQRLVERILEDVAAQRRSLAEDDRPVT